MESTPTSSKTNLPATLVPSHSGRMVTLLPYSVFSALWMLAILKQSGSSKQMQTREGSSIPRTTSLACLRFLRNAEPQADPITKNLWIVSDMEGGRKKCLCKLSRRV
eukprot:6459879-Amphidinium_carterae.1